MFDSGCTIRFKITIEGEITCGDSAHKPVKPTGGSFAFTREGNMAKVIFSGVNPPIPSEHVTSRTVVLTVAGVDSTPFDILDGSPAITNGNEGDTVSAVVTDTNSVGSTAGDPVDGGVITLPLTAPSKPTGGAFTFSA